MGMFDLLIVNCPNCGKKVELQSKAWNCTLDSYTLETAPLPILADFIDYGDNTVQLGCLSCNAKLKMNIEYSANISVKE